jgi:D-alanyl-lipoteichoic acid acyltransferase DltB (MBOAT superfamily)
MLFPTFDFLVFAMPVLLAFWALAHRPVARVLLLLVASYFFYMAGPKTDPPPLPWYYAGLLLFSTVLDYACGLLIHRQADAFASSDSVRAARARRIRNAVLVASVVGNLGLLGYFKYTDFFVHTAADIADALGVPFARPVLRTVLPIGISFYTFQSLSYTIDVWRGRLTPERSFRKFALFVTFFPQLVAGPIVRANEFLPQLHQRPKLDARRMDEGLFRIFKGLVKKVVLGDWIAAQFTDAIFATPEQYSSPEIMLGLYAFTLQLYADFSGYSDIAIGVARLLGYDIPENFDRPHQARNVGEFWRRWHMTLSTWLRDYLFFPLGGSRGSPSRTYFNLWLTMFLVGMWHYKTGTSWNFVIYANLQAGAILFNRWHRIRNRDAPPWRRAAVTGALALGSGAMLFALAAWGLGLDYGDATIVGAVTVALFVFITWLPITGTPLNNAVHIAITFHFTVVSRIFFRAESFDVAKRMVAGLLDWSELVVRSGLLSPWVWLALVFGIAYHYTPKEWVDGKAFRLFCGLPGPLLGIALGLLGLALMKLMTSGPRAFIYFDF